MLWSRAHACARDLGVENESSPAKGLHGSDITCSSFIILCCGTLLNFYSRRNFLLIARRFCLMRCADEKFLAIPPDTNNKNCG
jgi:hypothetical protein